MFLFVYFVFNWLFFLSLLNLKNDKGSNTLQSYRPHYRTRTQTSREDGHGQPRSQGSLLPEDPRRWNNFTLGLHAENSAREL